MITLYTQPQCTPCRLVKAFFTKHGIEYEEKQAAESLEYLTELGYRQAPVVVTEEGEHFYGYNITKLQQIAGGS